MKISLAILVVASLFLSKAFERFKLPGLLAMLIVGMILGPSLLNVIDQSLLDVSLDFRLIVLIIILLRAGLGIDLKTLKSISRTAIIMSFLPGLFEGFAIAFFSMKIFDFSFIQGGILGFVLAAVSPAVVVPSMLELMEKGYGKEKNIPTMILSAASIDDVVAITIFTSFMSLYGAGKVNIFKELLGIPLSILAGIVLGVILAIILLFIIKRISFNLDEVLLLTLFSLVLFNGLEAKYSIATLIGVMALGVYFREKDIELTESLSLKLSKVWIFGQIILFTLIGSAVDISHIGSSVGKAVLLIFLGLVFRSLGVYVSLLGTDLNLKEKIFTIIAYTPKATVQAAIGSIPLSAGVAGGDIILTVAVLSIIITAPLGAIAIRKTGHLLEAN